MQRKRGELVPIDQALADLPGPVQVQRPSPPTQRHFTQADQVHQLVSASGKRTVLNFRKSSSWQRTTGRSPLC